MRATKLITVFMILLAISAQAELKKVEMTIFGMD